MGYTNNNLIEKLIIFLFFSATLIIAYFLFDLFLSNCFFEQGCGEYEYLKIITIIIISCIISFCINWITYRTIKSHRVSK